MLKTAIGAGFGLALLATPSGAQMSCNAYDIANALDSTKNMQDASQKDETMREVSMARQSMLNGNRSGCDAHMQRLDQLTRQR